MFRDHALPRTRVAVLESEALRIRAVSDEHRMASRVHGAEHVGAQHHAVVHRDRYVPVDAHAVAQFVYR